MITFYIIFYGMVLLIGLYFVFAGGTIIGPQFGGFSPFGPPPPPSGAIPLNGMTGKPDPRCQTIINDQNHMVHLHPAFYPQPILYWGYPSPPVSPTTYYGPPPPTAAPHLAPPNLAQTHQPALVSLTDLQQSNIDITVFYPKILNNFYKCIKLNFFLTVVN